MSLSSLFRRALGSASRSLNLPTIEDYTQELIRSCLADLREVESRVLALSLFSPNETLEDISTRDLVYLFVPWALSEVAGRVRILDRDERIANLLSAQKRLYDFVMQLDTYDVVPQSERELHASKTSSVVDPATKREIKIKQYQAEKELRTRIDALQRKRRPTPEQVSDTDFDLIASLLPAPKTSAPLSVDAEDNEEATETESLLRDTTLLLLRRAYAQAHAQLESMDQELKLLKSVPPNSVGAGKRPEHEAGQTQKQKEEDLWKLDAPQVSKGPLLDTHGKPLRPFTILPAGATDRARLQSQVFSPDHNLPTMTVDEYLEIERARGGIISGGGPQTGPTTSEQLEIDSEQDGTVFGEEKAEEKRLKDEKWSQFTDVNPKGAGNTMNRG